MSENVDVELVHLDDCPLWRGAAKRLREAMRTAGLDPTSLRYRSVATEHAPADFPGSPTILVEGRDPFAVDVPAGPTCRSYPTEGGLDLAPSVGQLVRALGDGAATTAVRRHAFRALLEGRTPTAAELASAAALPTDDIEGAIGYLRDMGALEVDPTGRVVGAHGLTRRTTRHAIVTSEGTRHTWCALDAVGIPVALGLDAEVRTRCPTCGAAIVVIVRGGTTVAAERAPVLWQPGGPCSHVMDDFCAAANLFCDADHLAQWRAQAGQPPGRLLTISEVAERGRRVWSDVGQ